jgi:hypothetical protein
MMHPGLDKPGALPLLIVVIFSLLTLAPSLSNIYNLKLTDFSFNTHGARRKFMGICIALASGFPRHKLMGTPRIQICHSSTNLSLNFHRTRHRSTIRPRGLRRRSIGRVGISCRVLCAPETTRRHTPASSLPSRTKANYHMVR